MQTNNGPWTLTRIKPWKEGGFEWNLLHERKGRVATLDTRKWGNVVHHDAHKDPVEVLSALLLGKRPWEIVVIPGRSRGDSKLFALEAIDRFFGAVVRQERVELLARRIHELSGGTYAGVSRGEEWIGSVHGADWTGFEEVSSAALTALSGKHGHALELPLDMAQERVVIGKSEGLGPKLFGGAGAVTALWALSAFLSMVTHG
jgi:hypothetical protein